MHRPKTLLCLSLTASLFACTVEQDPGAANAKASAAGDGQDRPEAQGPQGQQVQQEGAQLLSNDVLDLGAVLAKSPEAAEAVLGTPKSTNARESSCVRFVPDRVFFKCKHDLRTYDHPKLERLTIDYQDGRAAEVQLVGLQGTGGFTPDAALAVVGLVLPGQPHHSNPPTQGGQPGSTVDVWDWGNSAARLLAEGRQFRVRLSVVNNEWSGAKVEILDNTPLNADEQARIMPVKGGDAPAPE